MKKKESRPVNKRLVAIITACVLVLVIGCVSFLALHGARFGPNGLYILKSFGQAISLGRDLGGGVYAVYQADPPAEGDLDALLDDTMSVLRSRLVAQGLLDAMIAKQGADSIRIEIPNMQNQERILSITSAPAVLEFRDADGNTVMEGKHVKTATPYVSDGQYVVHLELTSEGKELFAEATANNIGKTISIVLDGVTISSPSVSSAITEGTCTISGGFTLESASQFAMLVQSGALPLNIKQVEQSAITGTLGAGALDRLVLVGAIGMALAMLLLLVRYRLCGLAAAASLVVHIIAVFFLLAAYPGIRLTLPGIAGIALGIIMALDANIIVFERMREEFKTGRNISYALRTGSKNALPAVLNVHVVMLIAAFACMVFGTGSIKSFANTLAISAAVSMVTVTLVTRSFLRLCINMGIHNPKLYSR